MSGEQLVDALLAENEQIVRGDVFAHRQCLKRFSRFEAVSTLAVARQDASADEVMSLYMAAIDLLAKHLPKTDRDLMAETAHALREERGGKKP